MLFKQTFSLLLKDFKLLSFVTAIVLYAVLGSPTPDFPGVIELLIAILLLLSIGGLVGLVNVFSFFKERHPPFLLTSLVLSVIFSARVLYTIQTTELLYLANSPIVMFSLFFLPFWAARKLYIQFTLRHELQMLFCLAVSGFILLAVLQDVQRAPVFALSVSTIALFTVAVFYAPRRIFYLLPFFLIPVFLTFPYLQSVVDDLLQKTVRVGVNMRFQELEAIWASISQNPWTVLFGSGWGGVMRHPLSVIFM